MWLASLALAASFEEHQRGTFYAPREIEEKLPAGAVADFAGFGSGFLLADGQTLLTCLHVASAFGAEGTVQMGRGTLGERAVRVAVQDVSRELDLALYRAERPLGEGFSVRQTPAVVGEAVMVMGHPGKRPVRASYGTILRTGIQVRTVPAMEYDAMTDWGSSGSVVLDRAGQALAVHWAWDDQSRWGGWMLGIPLLEAAARWPKLARAMESAPR